MYICQNKNGQIFVTSRVRVLFFSVFILSLKCNYLCGLGLHSKYKINSYDIFNNLRCKLLIYHFISDIHKNLFSPPILYGMQHFGIFSTFHFFPKKSLPRSLRQIVFQSLLLIFNKRPHFYLMSR